MNPPDGEPSEARARERSSLRRELLAILVLYLIGLVLPLCLGIAFGPRSR